MRKTESPLAATMQMREEFIKAIVDTAARLVQARQYKINFKIACIVGGGLALVRSYEHGAAIFKFGSVRSVQVAKATPSMVASWNRQHLNHQVELMPLQTALEKELVAQSIMLNTIEGRRIHFETNGEG